MKRLYLFICFLSLNVNLFAQSSYTSSYVYDRDSNIIDIQRNYLTKGPYVLFDSTTNVSYVLDATQNIITAIDAHNNIIWSVNPLEEHELYSFRAQIPMITYMYFYTGPESENEEVIWIYYNTTHFGYIHKDTGEFHWLGFG